MTNTKKYNFLAGDYLLVGKTYCHLVAILNEEEGLVTFFKNDDYKNMYYKKVKFEKCERR